MTQWKVTHRFKRPVVVRNRVTSYPASDIELCFEAEKLSGVIHTLTAAGQLSRLSVVEASRKAIMSFMDMLEYQWGSPIRIAASSPELVSVDSDAGIRAELHGTAVVDAASFVARPVLLPDPEVLETTPSRLGVWLRLAIEAREARNPADAVRNYYMIWEDLKNSSASVSRIGSSSVSARRRPDASQPEAFRSS